MAGKTLGVGIIGAGGIANSAHIPNYKRHPRAEVIAVADVDPERARATAERHGFARWFTDYHDLLALSEVEAVSVTTPVFAHAEPAIAAMEAGKHVLCEKPIARTLPEANEMVKTAKRTGVIFTMGYQSRFSRMWEYTKRVIDAGALGQMYALNIVSGGKAGLPQPWFLDKEKSGGGILIDWGIYTAYMINWLAGPVSIVYAATRAVRTEYPAGGVLVRDVKVEDTSAVTLQFASGAIGVWYSTWAGVTGHGYTAIDGTEGSLIMRPGNGDSPLVYSTRTSDPDYLQGWRKAGFTELSVPEQHYRKLDHFVTAVLDGTPLVMTGEDGRDALELITAIYQSAETGQPVALPLER